LTAAVRSSWVGFGTGKAAVLTSRGGVVSSGEIAAGAAAPTSAGGGGDGANGVVGRFSKIA
jgi:hypothetical protein